MGKENTVYDEILGKFKQSSSDKFAAIAAEQFNKLLEDINNNFSGQMCPDQYVGEIKSFKEKDKKNSPVASPFLTTIHPLSLLLKKIFPMQKIY